MADAAGLLAAVGVVLAGVLAPGFAVVRGLRLARDPLLSFVLSVAVGRVGFAAVTLLATGWGGRGLLFAALAAGLVAAAAVALRDRRTSMATAPEARGAGALTLPVAVAVLAAVVLVHAVVGRSGLPGAGGDLLFFGRDATNDPLVYGAMALRLAEDGLPLTLPFGGGGPAPAPYGSYALLAGLRLASGASILDLVFRVVPLFDAATMTLSGVALVRALGGGTLAAVCVGVFLALGTEASFAAAPLAGLFGRGHQPLDTWALFGPYLAAFNPIAPAMQTWLAACALLATLRPGARAAPLVAGLLVAALFEIKLFLWAPALAGLVAAAWLRPPSPLAPALRLSAGAAALGSLPSVIDRLVQASNLAGRDETAFHLCVGCLPRYVAEAAWGSHDLSFALFRSFRLTDLADPRVLVATGISAFLVGAIALGARAFALPVLWRGVRGEEGPAVALRVLGFAALAGFGAAFLLVTTPHYLNGAQFAWAGTFGLWPVAALAFERFVREGRLLPAGALLVMAFLSTPKLLGALGHGAPIWQRVPSAEIALLQRLPELSASGDLVLEPSMIADPDRPSPVPWVTGRPVYLSLLSAVQSLPEAEREARFDALLAVFLGTDRDAAAGAIARSGAAWVYAPAAFPLRFDVAGLLEPVARATAGTLYRVADTQTEGGPGRP